MQMTFIGHQSWLIEEGETRILLDPVFEDFIGVSRDKGISIYPPRDIIFDELPSVDAIIISHEHSDHFHLPTLALFKDVPIYISHLMPSCVTKLLERTDFTFHVVPFQKIIEVGELSFTLYHAGQDTVLWESRVSQVYFQSLTDETVVYVAIDALLSEDFVDDVNGQYIDMPNTFVVTNNSQITPKGVIGSLDNCYDVSLNDGPCGISILHEIIIRYVDALPSIKNFIICGGGFTKQYEEYFGAYHFSRQKNLAGLAQYLCPDKYIYGPDPGEIIEISSIEGQKRSVNWINIDEKKIDELENLKKDYAKNPVPNRIRSLTTLNDSVSFDKEKSFVQALNLLSNAILYSEFGKKIFYESINSTKDEHDIFVMVFYLDKSMSQYIAYKLCFESARFIQMSAEEEPFKAANGIEVFMTDYLALIQGYIQIWDLAGIAIQSWYSHGESLLSPIAFLYCWYGEQIQPRLNQIAYQHRWSHFLENEEVV